MYLEWTIIAIAIGAGLMAVIPTIVVLFRKSMSQKGTTVKKFDFSQISQLNEEELDKIIREAAKEAAQKAAKEAAQKAAKEAAQKAKMESRIQTAKALLSMGIDLSIISKATDLSEEQILSLREETSKFPEKESPAVA